MILWSVKKTTRIQLDAWGTLTIWSVTSRYHPRVNWCLFSLVVWLVNICHAKPFDKKFIIKNRPAFATSASTREPLSPWPPITGKEVVAIDFMKEHLRKMLTDLDQDLEIPHWPSASPVEHKQTTGFLLKLRNVCGFCLVFVVCVKELSFIEQDDFLKQCQSGAQALPQNVRLRFNRSYTSTKRMTITFPNFGTHCGPSVLED